MESIVFSSDSQIQILQDNTFNDCISLTSIHIPASITDIRYGCFNGCISLTDISFENNSKLESIGGSCFYGCTQIHRIQMQNCTNLKEIGSGAFLSSDLIYYMQIGTTTPPDLGGNDVFGNVGTYSVLKVPAGSESSYRNKQGWNEFSSITSL
ncbi:MAG: leucine-rich repeat domain-containing protein [Candidatus Cryptobacteroides sp.]